MVLHMLTRNGLGELKLIGGCLGELKSIGGSETEFKLTQQPYKSASAM